MKSLIREYGFLVLLVGIGVGAYFLYARTGVDLLDSSLDAIAVKLQGMVERPEDKAYVADIFESFRQKVRTHEVSPEQLERVAANVLNMSRSGSQLTPEEAKVLFDIASIKPDSLAMFLGVARGGLPSPSHDHDSWQDAEDNLFAALAFEEALSQADVDSTLRDKFRYDSRRGLKVVLSDSVRAVLHGKSAEAFKKELERLERLKILLPSGDSVVPARAHVLLGPDPALANLNNEVLSKLRSLRDKGYAPPADVDSLLNALDARIERLVQSAVDSALQASRKNGVITP